MSTAVILLISKGLNLFAPRWDPIWPPIRTARSSGQINCQSIVAERVKGPASPLMELTSMNKLARADIFFASSQFNR